nr:hypothetical protein [PVC group bacterium]
MRAMHIALVAALTVVLAGLALRCEAATFDIPIGGVPAAWEAERAQAKGKWQTVQHAWADGGAYAKAGEAGAVLEFPFECGRATSLRVWPVWWRHGERKSA